MGVVLGAPDRVNIPCLMHDTRLCQLDVKMTNNCHGTKSIQIQNLSRCKKQVYTTYYMSSQKTRHQKLNSYLVMNVTMVALKHNVLKDFIKTK